MSPSQAKELLLQALEHGRGVVLVYRTALECAVNEHLRSEWETCFDQTENHLAILTRACIALGLDPGERTPGCEIVHHLGIGLVVAMKRAMATGDAQAAELVACECVVLAETRDHTNWDLLCECARTLDDDSGRLLAHACAEVQDEEDQHLYRARSWNRELWLRSLGLEARIPPEEGHEVATPIAAAAARRRARAAR